MGREGPQSTRKADGRPEAAVGCAVTWRGRGRYLIES